jgi:nucleotide-binding universal stress UspA family protein
MQAIDRILVPVDLGSNTEVVIESAASVAAPYRAELQLLYVIEEVPHSQAAVGLLEQAACERLSGWSEGLLARGIECARPLAISGRPFDAIVRTAQSLHAHLIVMGRSGRGSAEYPVLGTTTSRVMRRTAKPVLAVPTARPLTIRRILCPVDCSNAAARGLRNAIRLAAIFQARLSVMTVITDMSSPFRLLSERSDFAKIASDYEKMEREQFEQFIKGFDFQGITSDREIHYGYAADEIVRLANDAGYDLIVMGSTGRSGLPRVLLGSTAETVARRAPCAVLTVNRENVLSERMQGEIMEINELLGEARGFLEAGRYEEALCRFDQCLLKDPYLASAIEGQADAHERLGHPEIAAPLREQADLIRRELWHQRNKTMSFAGKG